ncbi:MAG: hypothetical protein CVV31_13860 [Methanomicrobiales archaeon HGW-Methanomicrobiales-2]|nr:MAG: hypothetical protein CVV31_13860 [Methanomicrobiales archaeon HGW-Methanomicrobiales-2]
MIPITYYSWQGHTEKVATALAERVGVGVMVAFGMRFVSSASTLESEVDAGQFGPAIEEFARIIVEVAAPVA